MPVEIHAKEFDAGAVEQALTLHDRDLKAVNTKEQPGRVTPKPLADVKASGERIQATLPPASWNVVRVALKKR
jgi:alpha-N-arabinofuranosidase